MQDSLVCGEHSRQVRSYNLLPFLFPYSGCSASTFLHMQGNPAKLASTPGASRARTQQLLNVRLTPLSSCLLLPIVMAATQDLEITKLVSVRGHVCLVTGGGSGIGLTAAQALAANGAQVYIVGRNEKKLNAVVQHHGTNIAGEIIPLVGDITDKNEIRLVASSCI